MYHVPFGFLPHLFYHKDNFLAHLYLYRLAPVVELTIYKLRYVSLH